MATGISPYYPLQSVYGTPSSCKQTTDSPGPTLIYSPAHLEPHHTLPFNSYWHNPHGSSVDVLNSLLPHDPNGPLIYYFYVATQDGFSLLLYGSKLEDSFMSSFLSGCDPIGGSVDLLIMEARYKRIPPKLFDLLERRMTWVEGLPPHVAVQGNWLSPDYRFTKRPTGGEIKSMVVNRFGKNPLECRDGAHIPIGK